MKQFIQFAALFLCLSISSSLGAAVTVKDGRLVDLENIATLTAEEHYQQGCEAYNFREWREAVRQFNLVCSSFPFTPYAKESYFYLGVSYFYQSEYEFANQAFNEYLKCQNNPDHLEDTIEFKFNIAESFREGAKRRILGSKKFPKLLDATELALDIYDEIITAFPCHGNAAKALFSKGSLLWVNRDYPESIEAFQTLIRRFPKHELATESYLAISRVYREQATREYQNPELLEFAKLNLKKFQRHFPSEERLTEAEFHVQAVKEIYAWGLFDTGRFYERKSKKGASILYYQNAIERFPDTSVAESCRFRLRALGVDPEFSESEI